MVCSRWAQGVGGFCRLAPSGVFSTKPFGADREGYGRIR